MVAQILMCVALVLCGVSLPKPAGWWALALAVVAMILIALGHPNWPFGATR